MKLFENSGESVDPKQLDFFLSIAKWTLLILFVLTLLFFNVLWDYL